MSDEGGNNILPRGSSATKEVYLPPNGSLKGPVAVESDRFVQSSSRVLWSSFEGVRPNPTTCAFSYSLYGTIPYPPCSLSFLISKRRVGNNCKKERLLKRNIHPRAYPLEQLIGIKKLSDKLKAIAIAVSNHRIPSLWPTGGRCPPQSIVFYRLSSHTLTSRCGACSLWTIDCPCRLSLSIINRQLFQRQPPK